MTSSSNIFLGVAKRDVRMDSYLGKDNQGWGWIGNKALWHNGSKQKGTYGEKFTSGDTVKLALDLIKGTLYYALNGKDLGIAFGPGSVGPRLQGPLYPGFALYNQRDCIDLIGRHQIEEGGEGTMSDDGLFNPDCGSADDASDVDNDVSAHCISPACELSAPLSFEQVNVSGQGLPKNDQELKCTKIQQRFHYGGQLHHQVM